MLSSKMTQDRIQVAQLLRQMDMFLKQVAQDRCQLAQRLCHEQKVFLRMYLKNFQEVQRNFYLDLKEKHLKNNKKQVPRHKNQVEQL
jgi:hypothetical protein